MDRALPVWILSALALVVLMALPLGWLGWLSVSGEHGATLAHYRDVFTDLALRKALWNTVVLAFWVGLASVALGAPLAWLTARTDIPGRGLIRGLVLASFVTPPFLGAFAWVMLAGPNAGILNTLWRSVTGSREPLLNIFTMPGLIFIVAIYTFPYVYIMVANTLALIASDLEEAAAILGAGRLTVARTVTLPMVLPALASGFILAVLQALALFGSPAILALPAGFHTVTTLELGVMTACVGAVMVAVLSYVTNRRLVVGHQFVAFLALAPVVVPGVVLAVGLFIAYTRPPFVLYGTLWILFLAYLTKEMPVGYAQADATFRAIPADLEDAGRVLGAGRLRILKEVTAPLAKSGIIAAWCFIFIGVIRELSASILLFTPSTKVMSVVIFDLKEEGQFGAISVLGLVMLGLTFATVALVQAALGRDVLGARR